MSGLSSGTRLSHKGYDALVSLASNDIFYGKVLDVEALLIFEGATIEIAKTNFEKLVDYYILHNKNNAATCGSKVSA